MAAITGLVVPGNQRHFGAKVAARILSFYCRNFCRRSNQKKCYKHVALEFDVNVANDVLPVWWIEVYSFCMTKFKGLVYDWGECVIHLSRSLFLYLFTKIILHEILIEFLQKVIHRNHFEKD